MVKRISSWQSPETVKNYLDNIKSGAPLGSSQIGVMLRLIDANGLKIKKFLDLGSGDGFLTSIMLSEYHGSHGVLIDNSESMLEAAEKKLSSMSECIKIMKYDLGKNEWFKAASQSGPYEAVVSRFAIHHLTGIGKKSLYRYVYSLLRKGGIFVNIEHVASPGKWAVNVFDDCFIDSLYENRKDKGLTRAEIAKKYLTRPDRKDNILAPVEQQCSWLRNIGFKDVDCYFKIFELAVFAGRKL